MLLCHNVNLYKVCCYEGVSGMLLYYIGDGIGCISGRACVKDHPVLCKNVEKSSDFNSIPLSEIPCFDNGYLFSRCEI